MKSFAIAHLRWYIVACLFLATLINYVDRQTLSIAVPVIRDEYGLSNSDYSWIVSAFLLAYTIMQFLAGRIIDRLGTKLGFAVFFTWWSLAAMAHAFARNVVGFGCFRFLLGMGEAGNWPGAVKAVAEWFPAEERALAAGFFNSGSSLGAVVAPPLITWIIVEWGWRAGFAATGAAGLAWLILWIVVYDSPEKHAHLAPKELALIQSGSPRLDRTESELAWSHLFRYRQLWGLVLGRALSDPVWWFYVFWLPEYLKRQRGFSLVMIGKFAWIPFFAAGIGGFAGGTASSWLVRRGWNVGRARKTVLVVSAAIMTCGIPAALTPDASWSLAFVSVATFAYAGWAAVLIAIPTDVFPKEVVASVYGITGTAAGFSGMIFTMITGKVVDHFSYVPVFVAAGILPLIAAVSMVTLIGEIAPLAIGKAAALKGDA
jgi:MFS transporter, ACS family, hexuronate transporter